MKACLLRIDMVICIETDLNTFVPENPEISSPTLKKTARLGGAATFHVSSLIL